MAQAQGKVTQPANKPNTANAPPVASTTTNNKNQMATAQKPASGNISNRWSSGIFTCCENQLSYFLIPCLCGYIGSACVYYRIAKEIKPESPYNLCLWWCCCLCIGATLNRKKVRDHNLIEGTILKDCLAHCFCHPCAISQEYREAIRQQPSRN